MKFDPSQATSTISTFTLLSSSGREIICFMEYSKFRYVHDPSSSHSIDVHHISLNHRRRSSLLLLLPISFIIAKEVWISGWWWLGFPLVALLIRRGVFLRSRVQKESVLIMPDFGVQLETHYGSGRKVVRRFVPVGKLLQPVLNECVTPVTCYWSLSMIVRGEEELLLAFKELRPPVKMLIPVWKALCAAIDSSDNHNASSYTKMRGPV